MKTRYLLLTFISIFALLAFNKDISAECVKKCWREKKSCENKCDLKVKASKNGDLKAKANEIRTCESNCSSTLEGCKSICETKSDCLEKCNDKLESLEDECTKILTEKDKTEKVLWTRNACQKQYDNTPATVSTFYSIEPTARNKMEFCMTNSDTYMQNCKVEQKEKTLNGSRNCNKLCSKDKGVDEETTSTSGDFADQKYKSRI